MRVALGIEYDGSSFHGWQTQPEQLTIQDAINQAVGKIAQEKVSVTAAGRTDTGVHATSQVAHFDVEAKRPLSAWVRGVNSNLPGTITVLWACEVDRSFHARFAATGRRYTYVVLDRPTRPAILDRYVAWSHRPLDARAMARASRCLLGKHDFTSFRSAECQARSAVKTIYDITVSRVSQFIRYDLHADAFLHHMVRNIVGSLMYVGDGRREPGWMPQVLHGGERSLAAPTASPNGLYLTGVDYESKWGLPATCVPLSLPLVKDPTP